MPLAKDLNDLITKFGANMAQAAQKVLKPLYEPGVSPVPDMSSVEKKRSIETERPFKFFPSQIHKMGGILAGLRHHSREWMVCDPGSGKTAMGLGITYALLNHKNYRAIVMSPSHITRKWRREINWMMPSAYCKIITNAREMIEFHQKSLTLKKPMIAVIGKDRAKLGFDVDKPCAMKRKAFIKAYYRDSYDCREAKGINVKLRERGENGKAYPEHESWECDIYQDVAACPRCGAPVHETGDQRKNVLSHAVYIHANRTVRCWSCNDRLSTNAYGFRKNMHIDRYIQRQMKGVFDIMLADEIHELASAETIQGNCFGTISSACKYTLALTGTLIGGKASDLHALLWRMSPSLMRQRGYNLDMLRGGKIGAIARNERSFVQQYGVMEHQIVKERDVASDYSGRVSRGACGRKKTYKTDERPRPGISPDLFNHFLLERAVFMNLSELGTELPSLERVLLPVKMSDELRTNYKLLDHQLETAIKDRVTGKGPPVLAGIRIQALDSYLDRPYGWDPIKVPVYDQNGEPAGREEVAWPVNMDDLHLDTKDAKLLEVVQSELAQGRRCAIYPQFTGVKDVRPKLFKMLQDAGVRVLLMPDTVKPEAREDWIDKNIHEMDVLIVQPKRVMTGLDLIQFPSLIWYQVGYSTHVLRQASARARRPTQKLPCKVFFIYYAGTIQEKALCLMGEKEAASQALEGTFDCRALRALMNGGENDDIMSALASSLSKDMDAKSAWNKVADPAHPVQAPIIAAPAKRTVEKPSPRTNPKSITHRATSKAVSSTIPMEFLFDLAPEKSKVEKASEPELLVLQLI